MNQLTEKVIRCAFTVSIHLAQCLNYLKATKLRLCLLIDFGKPKLEVRRIANSF